MFVMYLEFALKNLSNGSIKIIISSYIKKDEAIKVWVSEIKTIKQLSLFVCLDKNKVILDV